MHEIIGASNHRLSDLQGAFAKEDHVKRLLGALPLEHHDFCKAIYQAIPVVGVHLEFDSVSPGEIRQPGDDFEELDPDRARRLIWADPLNVLDDISAGIAGPVVCSSGFYLIGLNADGGDHYYLRPKADVSLYQIYNDWVDPASEVPVPEKAYEKVANSFADVIAESRVFVRQIWDSYE